MTTISDPSAMTPDDPRWLSWFMQQRRFDRLSRKAQTGASLITDFAAGIYEMGYPGQRRGNYELSDLVKYARSTGGGRFNSSGVYEWVGNDVPRLDYDPVTLQPRGLLIEEQRTNLLRRSSEFDNAYWSVSGLTVTPNDFVAPDGTLTADKLAEGTDTGEHRIFSAASAVTAGATYSGSCFVRAAGRAFIQTIFSASSSWGGLSAILCKFDLTTMTVVSSGSSVLSAAIKDVGGGWVRISVTAACVATTPGSGISVILTNNGAPTTGIDTYTGDGTSGIYIWGAQLEVGAFPTSYIPTVASQVTRAADVASVNTLSPWYNASEGTLFVDWSSVAPKATGVEISDGTTTNRFILALNKPNESVIVVNGNIPTTALGTATTAAKVAIALRVNDVAVSINGAPALVDTLTAIPAVNVLNIGRRANGAEATNGHIKQLKYFPRRLSNSELQGITA